MRAHYHDILSRMPTPPEWFDENGVPRYEAFSPRLGADIYAHTCALLEIECQACREKFLAAISWHSWRFEMDLEYGDPPNIECCPSGPTMTSIPLRVVEWWEREDGEWFRRPEREVEIECPWAKEE